MRRRVLVIDDCATVIARVRSVLGEAYDVRGADGGFSALHEISQRTPDVILLDLAMPAVDGEHVARKLRDAGCKAPIIILTSASRSAAEAARKRMGARASLDKSCTPSELRTEVALAFLSGIHEYGRRHHNGRD